LIKLQVTRRIRLALFKFSVARLALQALSFHGVMAYRARLPGQYPPHPANTAARRPAKILAQSKQRRRVIRPTLHIIVDHNRLLYQLIILFICHLSELA
jgi:hypothetical protein